MRTHDLPQGQQEARTRWGTHASGAVFDEKKKPFLTEYAQEFLTQRVFCAMAGLGPQQELQGQMVMFAPGGVSTPDRETCILDLDNLSSALPIMQHLQQAQRIARTVQLGLFFIDHAARQRLCVYGTAELVANTTPRLLRPFAPHQKRQLRLHVQQAFFHCTKYVRTRIAGLTVPADQAAEQMWQPEHLLADMDRHVLTATASAFISQQVLCFLCTRNRQGHCAINHRGGAPGFLIPLSPSSTAPGGIILLPDYAGNGAFEAIGNLFETRQAALVIPNYSAQVALCLSGPAFVSEVHELSVDLAQRCPGAERVIALSVQHVGLQHGDWSATLAYEQAHAKTLLSRSLATLTCQL